MVATELKERRAECRSLKSLSDECSLKLGRIEEEASNLRLTLSTQCRRTEEAEGKAVTLNELVVKMKEEAKGRTKNVVELETANSVAISSYKKRAQSSIGDANARVAESNRRREEAEEDAREARAASMTAMETAVVAKVRVAEAEMSAKAVQLELESLVATNMTELENAKAEAFIAANTVEKTVVEADKTRAARDKLQDDLRIMMDNLKGEKDRVTSLERELVMAGMSGVKLKEEVDTLKDQIQKNVEEAFIKKQNQSGGRGIIAGGNRDDSVIKVSDVRNVTDSDGTIVVLQQELRASNDAIKELKEVMRKILIFNPAAVEHMSNLKGLGLITPRISMDDEINIAADLQGNSDDNDDDGHLDPDVSSTDIGGSGIGNNSNPLFYVIEKQSELKTTREEIVRLAGMLGDAESAKVEAFEAMDDMRRKMEEAEARLRRFEKLGSAASSNNPNLGGGSNRPGQLPHYRHQKQHLNKGDYGGNRFSIGNDDISSTNVSGSSNNSISSHNDSTTNLEYLKNVMLSYLNAKTLNEKKALVPVVGAVLELTADEQRNAIQSLEESAGMQGVGTSFLENVQTNGLYGIFS